MKDYLENRIAELKKADAEFCEKRWDMTKPEFERAVWREASNEATGRRRELEDALAFYNKNCGKVVVSVGDVTEAQSRQRRTANLVEEIVVSATEAAKEAAQIARREIRKEKRRINHPNS